MSLNFYAVQDEKSKSTAITFDDLKQFTFDHGIKVEENNDSIVFPIAWGLFQILLKEKLDKSYKFLKVQNGSQYEVALEIPMIDKQTIIMDDGLFHFVGPDAVQLADETIIKVIFRKRNATITGSKEGFSSDSCNCESVQMYYRILFIIGIIFIAYLFYYLWSTRNKY